MLNILLHQMANEVLLKYRFETTWDVNDMCKKYIGPAKACIGVDRPYCIIIYIVLVFIFQLYKCVFLKQMFVFCQSNHPNCVPLAVHGYIYTTSTVPVQNYVWL